MFDLTITEHTIRYNITSFTIHIEEYKKIRWNESQIQLSWICPRSSFKTRSNELSSILITNDTCVKVASRILLMSLKPLQKRQLPAILFLRFFTSHWMKISLLWEKRQIWDHANATNASHIAWFHLVYE